MKQLTGNPLLGSFGPMLSIVGVMMILGAVRPRLHGPETPWVVGIGVLFLLVGAAGSLPTLIRVEPDRVSRSWFGLYTWKLVDRHRVTGLAVRDDVLELEISAGDAIPLYSNADRLQLESEAARAQRAFGFAVQDHTPAPPPPSEIPDSPHVQVTPDGVRVACSPDRTGDALAGLVVVYGLGGTAAVASIQATLNRPEWWRFLQSPWFWAALCVPLAAFLLPRLVPRRARTVGFRTTPMALVLTPARGPEVKIPLADLQRVEALEFAAGEEGLALDPMRFHSMEEERQWRAGRRRYLGLITRDRKVVRVTGLHPEAYEAAAAQVRRLVESRRQG